MIPIASQMTTNEAVRSGNTVQQFDSPVWTFQRVRFQTRWRAWNHWLTGEKQFTVAVSSL